MNKTCGILAGSKTQVTKNLISHLSQVPSEQIKHFPLSPTRQNLKTYSHKILLRVQIISFKFKVVQGLASNTKMHVPMLAKATVNDNCTWKNIYTVMTRMILETKDSHENDLR